MNRDDPLSTDVDHEFGFGSSGLYHDDACPSAAVRFTNRQIARANSVCHRAAMLRAVQARHGPQVSMGIHEISRAIAYQLALDEIHGG